MSTIKVDTIATRTGSGNITASNTIAGTSATLSGTLGVTGATTLAGATVSSSTLNMSSSLLQFSGNISLPNVGSCLFRPVADTIAFGINNGQRVSVNQHGLLFGTDTAAANALDDYEEGTFSGVGMSAASGGAFTITSQDNAYVKIGKFVKLRIKIIFNCPSSTSGNVTLTGLPFASDGIYGMHIVYNNQSAAYNNDGGFFISTGTTAVRYGYSNAFQNVNNFQMWMEASYRTT